MHVTIEMHGPLQRFNKDGQRRTNRLFYRFFLAPDLTTVECACAWSSTCS